MDEPVLKGRGILLGKASDTSPEPSLFDLGGLEIETTDSTTVKTIAEPYLLASVNFYRTAILFFLHLIRVFDFFVLTLQKRQDALLRIAILR